MGVKDLLTRKVLSDRDMDYGRRASGSRVDSSSS
jgi:hypothetical protein